MKFAINKFPSRLTCAFAAIALLCGVAAAQRRPIRRTTPPIDYSKFSHATGKHQGECVTCHKIPSKEWAKASDFPDITDFPGHAACVGCHRPQFFKGQRPPICSVCHTKTSPRDEARFLFRNPLNLMQFSIEFPHDKHQDVIASLRQTRTQFAFAHAFKAQDNSYNNCAICHKQAPVPEGQWADNFKPLPATFKSSPTNHASCFNCHWKAQEPIAGNCNGCHKLAKPYAVQFAPTRISLKFGHESGGETQSHIRECTVCHINITKVGSLRGLKPEVPITSCTECHNKGGLRQDLDNELAALEKNRKFVCSYCHTSDIGKLDAPLSHFLIAERPPIKR